MMTRLSATFSVTGSQEAVSSVKESPEKISSVPAATINSISGRRMATVPLVPPSDFSGTSKTEPVRDAIPIVLLVTVLIVITAWKIDAQTDRVT